jgi:hypothetical protein
MECQVEKNEHFGHLLLYKFNRCSKAAEATQNICAVYREDSIAEKTAQTWFSCFREGNFDMSETLRLGQPCCASGGIWRGISIMHSLRGTWPSLLNAVVNNFAV